MRAAGLDFHSRALAEFELPEPAAPGPGEALVRVHEVGICATDRELAHFRFGIPPEGERYLALGHEALVEVETVGPGVTSWKRGDLAVPMIRDGCVPACRACAAARPDLCVTGGYYERGITRRHGYLAARVVDPVSRLVRVPGQLAPYAVLVEPLSVVEKALETAWRNCVLAPPSALVLGAGPVGLLAVLALAQRGLDVQCASLETGEHPRARLAGDCGARYVCLQHARPAPATLVFEASGSAAAAQLALELLPPLGVLVLIGAADFEAEFPGVRTVVHNLTVAGVVNAAPAHFTAALDDLAAAPSALLGRFLHRRPFSSWRESITEGGLPGTVKTVHPLH